MIQKIEEILEKYDVIANVDYEVIAEEILDSLSYGNWIGVFDEEPPINIDVLAKAPDGNIHLTTWRKTYNIFSCQSKAESTSGWFWKLI